MRSRADELQVLARAGNTIDTNVERLLVVVRRTVGRIHVDQNTLAGYHGGRGADNFPNALGAQGLPPIVWLIDK